MALPEEGWREERMRQNAEMEIEERRQRLHDRGSLQVVALRMEGSAETILAALQGICELFAEGEEEEDTEPEEAASG